MDDLEVRYRCLELAVTQARLEGAPADRNLVAEIQTFFYNHITGVPVQEASSPEPGRRKPKADKAPEIFK